MIGIELYVVDFFFLQLKNFIIDLLNLEISFFIVIIIKICEMALKI